MSSTRLQEEKDIPLPTPYHSDNEYILKGSGDWVYFRAPFRDSQVLADAYTPFNQGVTNLNDRNKAWVAIDVDPLETYVYNSEVRVSTKKMKTYPYTKITLAEYLERMTEGSELLKTRSENRGKTINCIHPKSLNSKRTDYNDLARSGRSD